MTIKADWLPLVLGRLTVFLFTGILLLTGLFFLGNVQAFLDSTQMLLIEMMDFLSLIFLFVAPSYLIFLLVDGVRQRKFRIMTFLLVILAILLVAALFFFSNFLGSWLRQT